MGAKRIINKIVRILLIGGAGFALLLYILGIMANLLGLMDMRRSDESLLALFQASAGDRAFVTSTSYLDGKISYAGIRRMGKADSVAVIFVHGSPGSMDAYTDYLLKKELQSYASLYTYDRLGYGNSQPTPRDLSLIEQSEQLYALTRHIGARQNIYVGHSLGCSILARLAMDHPDIVDGLVMVAAPIDPGLEPSSWWRPILDFPMIRVALPRTFHISNRELAPLKEDLEACLPLWEKVRCPVTFIHGNIDNLVPVENVEFGKKMLQKSAEVREIIMPGKGHFILWTEEELIVKEIEKMSDPFD